MKCPCCGKEAEFRISCNGNDSYWFCPDCFISSSSKPWKNLTKTKQALDVSVDSLKDIIICKVFLSVIDVRKYADNRLEEIYTILESPATKTKDVK